MGERLIKVAGTKFNYTKWDETEQEYEGDLTGGSGTAGKLKVKGTYLYYNDKNGAERRLLGILTGETGTPGKIRIGGNYFYYIDNNGDERYLGLRRMVFNGKISDGILVKEHAIYTTCHDAAIASNVATTQSYLEVGQIWYPVPPYSKQYLICRSALMFDTSELPDDAVISQAQIYCPCMLKRAPPNFDLVVVHGDFADPLIAEDYGNLLDETASRGSINTADITEGAAFEIELNETGIAEISKTGITKFGMRSSKDISSTPPTSPNGTGYEEIWFHSGNYTANPVRLIVYY